jgi:hypothetical protein
MFAIRDIHPGELIAVERALLVSPIALRTGPVPVGMTDRKQMVQYMLDEWEGMMEATFGRMVKENQEAYLALANSHLHDGSGPLSGISRTNGFGLEGLQDKGRYFLRRIECILTVACRRVREENENRRELRTLQRHLQGPFSY